MVDASDKQVYLKNGFKNAGKNLMVFLDNNEMNHAQKNVFKPQKFGLFTKDN